MQENKRKTYYMQPENIKKLDQYEKEVGAKKSTTVNIALKEFFERRESNKK